MSTFEYVCSLVVAMLVVAGLTALTAATHGDSDTETVCRAGRATAPVIIKGMSLYPGCPGPKRG